MTLEIGLALEIHLKYYAIPLGSYETSISFWMQPFRKKPVAIALLNANKLEAHYGLFDLLCIGIGATVGTGNISKI